jgi:4-amino-4-deoxy-L-arabinose transferase-like glycosyltransferase
MLEINPIPTYQKTFFKRAIVIDILLVAVFCSIFTYWFFRDLDKQGVYCDEALFGNAALSVRNNISNYYGGTALNLFGKKIPLMLNDYNGATDIYTTLPWVYIFGNKPIALHVPAFIWGFLTIIVMYPLCLRLFNSRLYSALVSIMLATSPTFILGARIGLFTANSTIFFALLSIFLICLWQEKKKRSWLFFIGLSLGTGFACRIQFLWFINAFLIYITLRKELRREFFIFKNIFVYLSGMFIGAFSFILGNIAGHFLSFTFCGKYMFISRTGISNFNYLFNFLERFKEAFSLMNSNAFRSTTEYPNNLGIYLFCIGAITLTISAIYKSVKRQELMEDNQLLPILIFIFVLMQSPFTPTFFDVHHVIVLLPFMCLAAASPVYMLLKSFHITKKPLKIHLSSLSRVSQLLGGSAVLLLLALFIIHNYRLLVVYKAYRNIHSGLELKWNVMSDALRFMEVKGIKNIGLGDTGLKDAILFLSNFSLGADEVFYAPYKPLSRQRQEELLVERLNNEKDGYYFFREENKSWLHFYPDFQRLVSKCNKHIELFREFWTPDDELMYVLYKVY